MDRIHLTFMDIVFDDNRKEYQIGDHVCGLLKMSIKGRLMMSDMKICLTCTAEVNWMENTGMKHHSTGQVYSNKQKLLDSTYAIPEDCMLYHI